MANFALSTSDPYGEVVSSLNYVLANLGQNGTATDANVLVANVQTGEITSNTTVVSYLYQYMDVQYANNSTGSSGFSSNCANRSYYGLRNTANTSISTNPADYVWYQVTGGFGTTKNLWYDTYGGRQIAFFAGNAAPQPNYVPTVDNQPINLDVVTGTEANQIINVNAYFASNATPATPSGGYYDFSTVTLTPPTGWSANIPTIGNTTVWISSDVFQGNATSNVSPSRPWTTPAAFITPFNANAGPPGSRGFVPMGFVLTASDPTGYTSSQFTTAFSASRSNPTPPIGLGYAPIANDTAQFAYQDLFTGNTITTVQTYDGTTWSPVDAQVVSGGLIVPGSITANVLNVNEVYAIDIQSTNANIGNIASPGYWLQASTGDAHMGGNVTIGNNLTVGQNAHFGDSAVIASNLSVGTYATIGQMLTVEEGAVIKNGLTVYDDATIGNNLTVGQNAEIGNNLTIGNNAVIGGGVYVSGLVTAGSLNSNTVITTNMIPNAVSSTTVNTTVIKKGPFSGGGSYDPLTTTITNSYNGPVVATAFVTGNVQATGFSTTLHSLRVQIWRTSATVPIPGSLAILNYLQQITLNGSGFATWSVNCIGVDNTLGPADPTATYYIVVNDSTQSNASIGFSSGTMTLQQLKR